MASAGILNKGKIKVLGRVNSGVKHNFLLLRGEKKSPFPAKYQHTGSSSGPGHTWSFSAPNQWGLYLSG